MQSYVSDVFMTGIMSDWEMSMIEDTLVSPRNQDRFENGENLQSMDKKRIVKIWSVCSWLDRNPPLNTEVVIIQI